MTDTITKLVEYSYFDKKKQKTCFGEIEIDLLVNEDGCFDEGIIYSRLPDYVKAKWNKVNYHSGDLYSVQVITITTIL